MARRYRKSKRSFRRRRSKRGLKKRYRRRGRKGPITGISKSKIVMFRYVDVDTPTITIGTGTAYDFNDYRLNNAYDVNTAIASSSMPGFQEWSAFYDRYRVDKCKVTTTITNTASNLAFYGGILGTTSTNTIGGTWPTIRRQLTTPSMGKEKMGSGVNSGKSSITLSKTFKNANLWGNAKDYYANGDASVVGAPQLLLQQLGYVLVMTGDGAPVAANLTFDVRTTIEMQVKFFDKNLLTV